MNLEEFFLNKEVGSLSSTTLWAIAGYWYLKPLQASSVLDMSRFVAAQYQHSLVERNIEGEFVPMFENEGLGLVPWSPLGGGFLSGKYKRGDKPSEGRISVMPDEAEESWHRRSTEKNWEIIEKLGEVAEERGKSYAQVALNWLRQKSIVTSIIVGARTPEQLEDNLGAFAWDLTDQELKKLDKVSAPEKTYPYRFIEEFGSR